MLATRNHSPSDDTFFSKETIETAEKILKNHGKEKSLKTAIKNNASLDVITYLINEKNCNIEDSSWHILSLSAQYGRDDVLKKLATHPFNISCINTNPLRAAIHHLRFNIIEWLNNEKDPTFPHAWTEFHHGFGYCTDVILESLYTTQPNTDRTALFFTFFQHYMKELLLENNHLKKLLHYGEVQSGVYLPDYANKKKTIECENFKLKYVKFLDQALACLLNEKTTFLEATFLEVIQSYEKIDPWRAYNAYLSILMRYKDHAEIHHYCLKVLAHSNHPCRSLAEQTISLSIQNNTFDFKSAEAFLNHDVPINTSSRIKTFIEQQKNLPKDLSSEELCSQFQKTTLCSDSKKRTYKQDTLHKFFKRLKKEEITTPSSDLMSHKKRN